MNVMTFETRGRTIGGRHVRCSRFEPRSTLALSAACLTANAMRELLKPLLFRNATVRLLTPVLPSMQAWNVLCAGARVYRTAGTPCEAALILRPLDALAMCCAIFGEGAAEQRDLSAFEAAVLDRHVLPLGTALSALTGSECALERAAPPFRFSTYFELIASVPHEVRLGIALSAEPALRPGGLLDPAVLDDVELELRAVLAGGRLSAAQVLSLRAGSDVPMKSRMGAEATLMVAGVEIARATPGRYAGQHALSVNRTIWGSATR